MWRFRHVQAREIMETQGPWIAKTQPRFGPEVKERFDGAATITETEAAAAREQRETFARRLAKLLGDDALLCLPTAPGLAPLCESNAEDLVAHRPGVLSLPSIAGPARLPAVTLPLARGRGCPLRLTPVGPGCAAGSVSARRVGKRCCGK